MINLVRSFIIIVISIYPIKCTRKSNSKVTIRLFLLSRLNTVDMPLLAPTAKTCLLWEGVMDGHVIRPVLLVSIHLITIFKDLVAAFLH